jgi:hypothetical protein
MQRPEPGKITTREIRIRVCGKCGYTIDGQLCSDDCEDDGGSHAKMFDAVYERTDKFLRDEPVKAPSTPGSSAHR